MCTVGRQNRKGVRTSGDRHEASSSFLLLSVLGWRSPQHRSAAQKVTLLYFCVRLHVPEITLHVCMPSNYARTQVTRPRQSSVTDGVLEDRLQLVLLQNRARSGEVASDASFLHGFDSLPTVNSGKAGGDQSDLLCRDGLRTVWDKEMATKRQRWSQETLG
jgi:hypothetical protein